MKYRLLTFACALALAAPAGARDNSAYFGVEIGPMWMDDDSIDIDFFDEIASIDVDHKMGVDGDMIAGYDFGLVRAEAEFGHKWARHDTYGFEGETIDADGYSSAYSLMGNLLLDVGQDESFNVYGGVGLGMAWLTQELNDGDDEFSIKDSRFAWQLIAGVRAPVFRHFDVGLKYRYFHGGTIRDDFDGDAVSSKFRSHSILASLIYNFNTRAPVLPPPPVVAAPPPPPAPATQTCPDGTVILATEPCPLPPPPPPPPPPTPERG